MASTIWKYPLRAGDVQTVELPFEAQILCAQTQDGDPYLWALVDPERAKVERHIRIYNTGQPIEAAHRLTYIGTFQVQALRKDGDRGGFRPASLVFHVFEEKVA